jgi:hypothetical protein
MNWVSCQYLHLFARLLNQTITLLMCEQGVAMFGGFALISLLTYILRGRKVYKGPVVDVIKR